MEEKGSDNCFNSRATSDVLFTLILGRRSPIEISKHVGDTPPAIIKQLWKLRKMGLVTLAEKSGKFQYYSVDWDKIAKAGVGLMEDFSTAMVLASLRHDKEKYNFLDTVKLRLAENEHFKSLFRFFVEEEARKREKQDIYLITTWTFQDAVSKFEKYLPLIFPQITIEPKEADKAEFLKLLNVLYEAILEAQNYESATLKNALAKSGLLKT